VGVIPKQDIPMLKKARILKVFPQNVDMDTAVSFLKEQFANV
jgi:methylmalonyl-CoA mutase cobalamin-binding subunit